MIMNIYLELYSCGGKAQKTETEDFPPRQMRGVFPLSGGSKAFGAQECHVIRGH